MLNVVKAKGRSTYDAGTEAINSSLPSLHDGNISVLFPRKS